jgi:predicted metal-binding membrane protein
VSLEELIRRDRAVAAAGLGVLALLAWGALVWLHGRPGAMAMAAPMPEPWSAPAVLLTFLMWSVMMVAMMVPAAAPMILLFATVNRQRAAQGGTAVPTGIFLLGYLVVWGGFSLAATAVQDALQSAALLVPGALRATPVLGGVLLLLAGFYQLTPLKYACLARCQSPLGFVLHSWREGAGGAFVMGVHHGAFCLGCCWALMALLFVAGVMNLVWVAALAGFVLVEKLLPTGRLVSWVSGAGLLGWGAWLLLGVRS